MTSYSRVNKNNEIEEKKNSKNSKNSKKRNKLKIIFIVLILLILSWFILLYFNFSKSFIENDKFTSKNIGSDSAVTLVVGVDGLAESELKTTTNTNDKDNRHGIRSDSIMLLASNPKKDKVMTLSIYRDLLTKNACSGRYDKINASFTTGWYNSKSKTEKGRVNSGVSCLKRTIESFYDIKINNYMVINFSGFERIIDSVGGVDVDVIGRGKDGTKFCEQDKYSEHGNPDESSWAQGKYCFSIGEKRHLNGEEALSYARHRHMDGDKWRTRRQNEVLKGLIKSIKNPLNLLMFPYKSSNISEALTTNISSTNILSYVTKHLFSLGSIEVEHLDTSFINDIRGGIYYLDIPKQEKNNVEKKFNSFLED